MKTKKHGCSLLSAVMLVMVLTGCGEELETVVPSSIGPLEVSVTSFTLGGFEPQQIAAVDGLETLIVAGSELMRLTSEGLVSLSDEPMVAMTELDASILVATATELFLWAGSLEPTYLDAALDGVTFQDVMAAGNQVWLATDAGLFRAGEDSLESFAELTDVIRIHTYAGAQAVVLERRGAGLYLLEHLGDDWIGQSLTEEGVEHAVAHPGPTIVGIANGELVMRSARDATEVVWQPVSVTDEATGSLVDSLMADPTSGATWIQGDQGLRRMLNHAVHTVSSPSPEATLVAVSAEGSVWLADGEVLYRLSPPSEVVSFAEHIVPFYESNCARCHNAESDARPLDTYESWVDDIDLIIAVVGNGTMPADGEALVGGTVELLESWKAGGLAP